jgi:hypothetical protein
MPHKYNTTLIGLEQLSYDQWSSDAQDAYQEFNRLADKARDYCDVGPRLMIKINILLSEAVKLDDGDGATIRRASRILVNKVLTQNF